MTPTTLNKLTPKQVQQFALDENAGKRLGDGGGLYVVRARNGASCSFMFIYNRLGRRRELGLGGIDSVTLAQARAKANRFRDMLAEDRDPYTERLAEQRADTFKSVADDYRTAFAHTWRGKHSLSRYNAAIDRDCKALHGIKMQDIRLEHVLSVITPLIHTKPTVAQNTLSVIRRLVDRAAATGARDATIANPARWEVIKNILPSNHKVTHHAAMPYTQVPAFYASLSEHDTIVARALQMLILTGSRRDEIRMARWCEFDLAANTWTVPTERMKAGVAHVVPLTDEMIALLGTLPRTSEYVFTGRSGGCIGDSAFRTYLPENATSHGMRSALRDYLGDCTPIEREVAEGVLAHTIGNETERAYRRSTAIEKRREALTLWNDFVAA